VIESLAKSFVNRFYLVGTLALDFVERFAQRCAGKNIVRILMNQPLVSFSEQKMIQMPDS
jgi:hypothetical protein